MKHFATPNHHAQIDPEALSKGKRLSPLRKLFRWANQNVVRYHVVCLMFFWLALWLADGFHYYGASQPAAWLTLGLSMFCCIVGLSLVLALPAYFLLRKHFPNYIIDPVSREKYGWPFLAMWMASWNNFYFGDNLHFYIGEYLLTGVAAILIIPLAFIAFGLIASPFMMLHKWLTTPRHWD